MENSGRPRGALQIPPLRYASVGMTKGRVALSSRFDAADDEQEVPPLRSGWHVCLRVGVCYGEFGRAEGRTAGPSTTLRFGRDDNSAWVLGFGAENSGGPKGGQH